MCTSIRVDTGIRVSTLGQVARDELPPDSKTRLCIGRRSCARASAMAHRRSWRPATARASHVFLPLTDFTIAFLLTAHGLSLCCDASHCLLCGTLRKILLVDCPSYDDSSRPVLTHLVLFLCIFLPCEIQTTITCRAHRKMKAALEMSPEARRTRKLPSSRPPPPEASR